MAVIGSLSVKLGLVTVEWDKATAKAKQEAKDLQTAFKNLGLDMTNLKQLFANLGGAAGLSVAGMTAMTAAIMDMASKMQDLADATGLTEGRVLQFQKALVVAGGKAEDAGTILGTLFTKIAAARDGNDVAIAQFEQLGITFEELKASTPDQVIKKVYDGLSQISDSFERVRVTKELLGKAGLGKSITDIADALGKSTKKFDEQAETLKKWDKMADALEATFANLKMAIAELLAPFTTQKVVTVEQFKAAFLAIGSALVVSQIMNLVAAFKALNTALKGTAALSAAIGTLKGGKGLAMGAAAIATYTGVMAAMGGEEEEPKGPYAEGKLERQGEAASGNEEGGKAGGSQAALMREKLNQAKEQLKYDLLRIDLQAAMLSGSQHQLKVAESITQKEEEQARAKSEMVSALAKENLTSEQRGLIEEEYNFKVLRANEMHKARVDLLNAQREKATALTELEIKQGEARSNQAKKLLSLEEGRRDITDAEYQRNRAQLAMEQKMLQIEQERQRLLLENKDGQNAIEVKQRLTQLAQQEKTVMQEYQSAVVIINNEEAIRVRLLRMELDYLQKRNDLVIKSAELQNQSRYMTEFEFAKAQEQIDLQQRLLDIEQQRQQLRATRNDVASEEYQSEMSRLDSMEYAAKREAEIRLQGIKLNEDEAMTWSGGWERAMREFAQNAERYGDVARAQFDSVVGNMNSAIDNFVRTGKFSFKDFAKSVIQDLLAIQMKAQAAFLLTKALGYMGFSAGGGVSAKAGGGAVSSGIPYMVGENGPELFVPQSGGAIVPTQRLGEAGNMGGQTINYNGPYIASMSAIDTQSAAQFLSRNKQAVWSANQSAARSAPVSR